MIARVDRIQGAYKLVVTIYNPSLSQPRTVELPDIFAETKIVEARVDGDELYILLLEAAIEFNSRMLLRHIIVIDMDSLEVIGEHDLELVFNSTGYKNFLESLHIRNGIVGIMDGENDMLFYNLRTDWQTLKTENGARIVSLSDGMYIVRRSQEDENRLDFNILDDEINESPAFSLLLPAVISLASFIKLNDTEVFVFGGMRDAGTMTHNHDAYVVNIQTDETRHIGKIPLKINDPYQSVVVGERIIYMIARDDKVEDIGLLVDLNKTAFKAIYYPKLFHETKKLLYYKKFKNLNRRKTLRVLKMHRFDDLKDTPIFIPYVSVLLSSKSRERHKFISCTYKNNNHTNPISHSYNDSNTFLAQIIPKLIKTGYAAAYSFQ